MLTGILSSNESPQSKTSSDIGVTSRKLADLKAVLLKDTFNPLNSHI